MSKPTKYQQKPTTSTSQQQETTQQSTTPKQQRTYNNNRSYNNGSYNNGNSYNNNGSFNNRRPQQQSRYQDKQNRFRNKFGFEYDQNKIGYNTEIPEMPQKLKQKPDSQKHNKKITELQSKVNQLKKQRKQKKDSYKNGSQQFRNQIEDQKHNIDLAKACLVILNFDKKSLENDIDDVQNKINTHKRKIDYLTKPAPKTNKNTNIEEMTFTELVREQDRIIQEMSTRSLTKAEQVQLSNKLNKIKKRKIQAPKKDNSQTVQNNDNLSQVQTHRNSIDKLRHVRQTLNDRITDIDNKIQSIEDNIQDFQQKIEQIHDKLRNTDNSKLLDQAAKLKQQIYGIWYQIKQLEEQFKAKLHDFDYEQQKIKYIQWAKQIKAKKAEQWEQEKQQRKRLRLKEKENKKKGDGKDQKPTKQGQKKQGQTTQEKPTFQRKKFNRNQKQIDSCAFLIQYCKDLNQGTQKTSQKAAIKQVKLEDALKKGQWGKMKQLEVIKSKKAKNNEQVETKTYKKRQNKNPVPETTDRFSHTYFVAQIFDSVKVLPPTKQEELQKVINELEDKMQYYIAHPDEGVDRNLIPEKQGQRETRSKVPRRIINTQQFPSLK